METLKGRVALVTGASRGAGAAIAHALAAQGVKLGLASRSGEDLGIEGAVAMRCDVRDPEQVEAITQATVERFGKLDIAIANAGVGSYGPFLELDPQQVEDMIDINLKGTIYTARSTLPHLIASGAGDFVSIASVAGLRAFPGETVYNASKFGQVGFTRALDHELMEKGVRATNLAPGGIATDFAMGTGRTPEMPELATMMTAEEVAETVIFVLTRPRTHRILTLSYRPMGEASWG